MSKQLSQKPHPRLTSLGSPSPMDWRGGQGGEVSEKNPTMTSRLASSLTRHLAVLLVYLGLSFLTIYPWVFNGATHVGGPPPTNVYNDYYHFHWNYWWMRHALTTPGLNVYETNFVLFPYTTNLGYHTLTPFWFPVWALLEPLTGTLIAMLVIILLAMTLSGACAFWFFRGEGVSSGWALAGGALYLLTPAMLLAVMLTDINYVSLFWYPLLLILWRRLARQLASHPAGSVPRYSLLIARHSLLLALALYGMVMTDLQHGLFLAFLLIPYGLWTLIVAPGWMARLRLVVAGSIGLGIALALLWFVGPLPYVLSFDRSTLSPMPIENALAIPFPQGFVWRFNLYDYRQITLGPVLLPLTGLALVAALWRTISRRRRQDRQEKDEELNHRDTENTERNQRSFPFNLEPIRKPFHAPHPPAPSPMDWRGGVEQSETGVRLTDRHLALSTFNPPPSTLVPRYSLLVTPVGFWLLIALPPLLLSAGATITLGEATIALPYATFHEALGGLFRVPARFAPLIILTLWLVVGRVLSAKSKVLSTDAVDSAPPLSQRVASASLYSSLVTRYSLLISRYSLLPLVPLLLFIFWDSRLAGLMPIQPVIKPYAFYQAMGQETGPPYDDYVVVEVPTAGGTGEAWVGEFKNMETQFYGMTHHKRMLNGSLARAPLGHYWYWLYDDPMIAWLGQRRFLEPEAVEAQLRERIFNWPVGYIVVHQDLIGREGPTAQEIIGWFNTLDDLLCPVWVEGDAVVYRTAWHPDGCPLRTPAETEPGVYAIDIGTAGDERFIGWGWHWPEIVGGSVTWRWTGQYPQTQLYVDLPPAAYTVTLSAQAFYQPRQLRLLANGAALVPMTLPVDADCSLTDCSVLVQPDGLQVVSFRLPAALVGDGRHLNLTLDYDGTVEPAQIALNGDPRRLALAVDWMAFSRDG